MVPISVPKITVVEPTSQSRENTDVPIVTSVPKEITVIANRCPSFLHYPTFTHPKECFNHNMFLLDEHVIYRTVLPYRSFNNHPKPTPYIYETGVVFYVYAGSKCDGNNKYLTQVLTNARAIKEKDPSVGCSFYQSFIV